MYTFGADPELFIFDTNSEKFISSHNLLPGTKADPFPVEYGAVQVDGVAAEFNIDPAETFVEFKRNINQVKKQMLKIIQENGGKHLELRASPTATFDKEYFDALPQYTKELGCDPDFCGQTKVANPRPNASDRPFRTGGGHVHIGWGVDVDPFDPLHFEDCAALARYLYAILQYDYLWDDDTERRSLYGSPYSFRPKKFGMEYRYLSNKWVDDNDAMKFVFQTAQAAITSLDNAYVKKITNPYDYSRVQISSSMRDAFRAKQGYGCGASLEMYPAQAGCIQNHGR